MFFGLFLLHSWVFVDYQRWRIYTQSLPLTANQFLKGVSLAFTVYSAIEEAKYISLSGLPETSDSWDDAGCLISPHIFGRVIVHRPSVVSSFIKSNAEVFKKHHDGDVVM